MSAAFWFMISVATTGLSVAAVVVWLATRAKSAKTNATNRRSEKQGIGWFHAFPDATGETDRTPRGDDRLATVLFGQEPVCASAQTAAAGQLYLPILLASILCGELFSMARKDLAC